VDPSLTAELVFAPRPAARGQTYIAWAALNLPVRKAVHYLIQFGRTTDADRSALLGRIFTLPPLCFSWQRHTSKGVLAALQATAH
jgi:hypothetical protein